MEQIEIADDQADLAKFLEQAARGEGTLITKDGKPIARILPAYKPRIGMLRGVCKVPDDFDTLYAKEIEEMFHGKDE